MRTFILFLTLALLVQQLVFSQEISSETRKNIEIHDFSGTHKFLSSDWMEGREAGTKGSFLAADFIAAIMENTGLQPNGDYVKLFSETNSGKNNKSLIKRSYFQDFGILKYKTEKSSLALLSKTTNSQVSASFIPEIEFRTSVSNVSISGEGRVVFAGYGLCNPALQWNDYKNIDVTGCVVVVVKGFPGQDDTTSNSWKKFGPTKDFLNLTSFEAKTKIAREHGAIALIEANPEKTLRPFSSNPINTEFLKTDKNNEPEYPDDDYKLPGDTTAPGITCFFLSSAATKNLFNETGFDAYDFKFQTRNHFVAAPKIFKEKYISFSVSVKTELLFVRNVIGKIAGTDTTRSIVIGAHYDHLGTRNGNIYNGADDNASGVAGMLALAKYWSEQPEKPAINLIFAAWTAEEKGMLGSSYFVEKSKSESSYILLNINFDMISRSAPEDNAHSILSVGTVKGSDRLNAIVSTYNQRLPSPFSLDLWQCSKDGGSDYASFAADNIPVMTFFTGFHNDYHTTRDIIMLTDNDKMKSVLQLANDCLTEFMMTINNK